MSETIIHCSSLAKYYQQGSEKLTVLQDIDFSINRGESVAIIGASGAGKSTLLNLIGGLDSSSEGYVEILNQRLDQLPQKQLARLRNKEIGFVYQFHHLLTEFDAQENVAMPLMIGGMKRTQAKEQAAAMLAEVGLAARLTHRPAELSGGERQRVAIARALVNQPSCVLMDEPTGNLDEHTAETIQTLLQKLNDTLKTCFVLVTHDKNIAKEQQRILHLHEGRLVEIEQNELA